MRQTSLWRAKWIAALGVLLAGCSFGLSQPAPKIRQFRLDYVAEAPVGSPLPLILRVPTMEVAGAYDRDPIVYREGEYKLGSYFYYRWASNPGSMIADLLARDLASSGLYRDVQTAVSMVPPNYQLQGTVEEIEERIAGNVCTAHLKLRLTLAASRGKHDERVRFSNLYGADDPTTCDDPDAIAASMSRAMAQVSAAVQADVYRELK